MNIEEFNKQFKNISQKTKILVGCHYCGKQHVVTKEKVQSNITKNGVYIDRSCAMKLSHKLNPRSQTTKDKQRKGRLGKKHTAETKKQMAKSADAKWASAWGAEQKHKLGVLATKQHATNKPTKSVRRVIYISKKNNAVRICMSSYEYIYCEYILELDDNVISYETQVSYEIDGRPRSLDFLVKLKDATTKAVEVKPKKRINEEYSIFQISDSKKNAETNGWMFELVTEVELKIKNSKEATKLADEYRLKIYNIDYASYRKERDRVKARKNYDKNIRPDTITFWCCFCECEHTHLHKTVEKAIEGKGRFICETEGGYLSGSLPKPHLRKDNPHADKEMKECTKCKEIKPFSEFGKDKSRRDGFASQCKLCRTTVETERYHKKKVGKKDEQNRKDEETGNGHQSDVGES